MRYQHWQMRHASSGVFVLGAGRLKIRGAMNGCSVTRWGQVESRK